MLSRGPTHFSTSARSRRLICISMIGLAPSPGTAVLPMFWMSSMWSPTTASRRAFSSSKSEGHLGSYSTTMTSLVMDVPPWFLLLPRSINIPISIRQAHDLRLGSNSVISQHSFPVPSLCRHSLIPKSAYRVTWPVDIEVRLCYIYLDRSRVWSGSPRLSQYRDALDLVSALDRPMLVYILVRPAQNYPEADRVLPSC